VKNALKEFMWGQGGAAAAGGQTQGSSTTTGGQAHEDAAAARGQEHAGAVGVNVGAAGPTANIPFGDGGHATNYQACQPADCLG
jgi:hypothetical protein